MDLEYLNGVPDTYNKTGDAQDFMGLMGEQEALSELGKIFKRKAASGGGGAPKKKGGLFKRNTAAGGEKKKGAKVKNFLKKGLHITNRLNPAAATLRAGILAAMKLNFMKIGGQIRYSYLTEEQAQQKGLIMDRYRKMKTIREKLEKIFYGAGGKPENLKKAILTGHGNKNKEVPMNGLGFLGNIDGLNEDMPLSQLLGSEIYADEMHGVDGLGSLGEPATAATIAAATTVLTTIAALIKSVGSLVPKKKAAGGDGSGGSDSGGGDSGGGDSGGDSGSDSSGNSSTSDNASSDNSGNDAGSSDSGSGGSSDSGSDEGTNGSASKPAAKSSGSGGGSSDSGGDDDGDDNDSGGSGSANKSVAKSGTNNKSKPTFWENNKKWIVPTGIGIGSLGLIALFWQLFKKKDDKKTSQPKLALNGLPAKKRKPKKQNLLNGIKSKPKKGGNHSKKKKTKKKVVTLL